MGVAVDVNADALLRRILHIGFTVGVGVVGVVVVVHNWTSLACFRMHFVRPKMPQN